MELLVLMVTADDPEPVTDAGLKVAEAPLGKPLAERDTVPLAPLMLIP